MTKILEIVYDERIYAVILYIGGISIILFFKMLKFVKLTFVKNTQNFQSNFELNLIFHKANFIYIYVK